ncbi:MAG: flagellar hook-associated protein FlgL [Clostridia bacterium]|nr:flagellar hook-associated protein FlgL [Clostridia bacterium]
MRVTNSMLSNNVLYNIQKSLQRMEKFSNQLSTGKRYVLAEDDPINTVLGMGFRTKITESEQFIRNIDDGMEWLNTCDSALGHTVDLLNSIRTKCIYGANDTLEQQDRDSLATDVDQLLNGIFDTANTEFRGDYIFSGTNTRYKPFSAFYGEDPGQSPNVTTHDFMDPDNEDRMNLNMRSMTDVKYMGNSKNIDRQIQQSIAITINDSGNNIFSAESHEITSGSMRIKDQNLPLNDVANFNGEIQIPNPVPVHPNAAPESTSFTIGVEGGYSATVSYNADVHSIIDIADMVNEKAIGVKAVVEKETIENVDYFKLKFQAEESGKEIFMYESDKSSEKTSAVPQPMPFDPDSDDFSAMVPSQATGEVFINGKQFILDDYGTVRQFMNAVANDPDAGVSEFTFDRNTGLFNIKADNGMPLDIKEKGDINGAGNMGFFSGTGINTRGNILETMKVFNKLEGTVSLQAADRNAMKSTYLNSIPGMEDGRVVVNGAVINIDADSDTLDTLAKKINNAQTGVYATVEEDIDPAGAPRNFRLVLRSEHPGKMNLENREEDIFTNLGFIDKYSGNYYNYPSDIKDPQDIGVFSVVMDIRDNLYKGDRDALEENLGRIDEVIEKILEHRSKIGARMIAAETSQSKLEDVRINTTNLLSNVEDVDIAETIMKMKMEENVQNAALQTGATIIQKSLIDFLR